MKAYDAIGFMQGRLSPVIDGRIQSFPWPYWRDEFLLAKDLGFGLMEWTLDQERLYENPLMLIDGREDICRLSSAHSIDIPSLTGDCFMQAPFWKASGAHGFALESDFMSVASACQAIGIGIIVIPLVDNGRLENMSQEDKLVRFLEAQSRTLEGSRLKIAFESDFPPEELRRFIHRLDPNLFGINYDIGNSASLGFKPIDEFDAYGRRILNVHVKDRLIAGTTVPLGTGNADFDSVFAELSKIKYAGRFILQTARTEGRNHGELLLRYREMTASWLIHSRLYTA